MPNPLIGLLYRSADMEEDLFITLEPMDKCMGGQFGVVFHAQFNGRVAVHIS